MNKIKKSIIFFLCLLLIIISLYITSADPKFKWPLNLPKNLTATLGETRGSYLHYGIDIKTNGRPGYPVFASASGKVSRIISRETGYGNALFLDHGNNMQTVYGHLEAFEQKKYQLNTLSKVLKIFYNTDNLDFTLNNSKLFFEKDEMIASAGESGSGLPHLHFEIRDDDKFLNPLDYIHIKDRNPPVIEGLYACIERENTTVYEEKIKIKKRFGTYKAITPVKISRISHGEKVFFKISCYDRIGTYNKLAIYRIQVFENKEKRFEIAFDNLTNEDIPLGSFIYDRSKSSIKDGTSYVYNLCKREQNNFSGFKSSGNGYINPEKDKTDIRILVSDFAGNEALLKFRITRENYNQIYTEDFSRINNQKSNKIYSINKNIKIIIPKGAVQLESLIRIEDSINPEVGEEICEEYGLKKENILKIFSVYPHDSVYKKPVKITIKQPGRISDEEISQISIYQFYEGKRPGLLKTDYSSFFNSFQAETNKNGYFALIMDSVPPDISIPPTFQFCEDREIYRKLRFVINDNISKVNTDSIECFIDGEFFPVSFDSDRDWIEVILSRNIISKNMHHIFIKAKDNANNTAVFRDLLIF